MHDGRRLWRGAASLAGHLRLSNLCWIYDNNRITIEGQTSLAFSEDVATRFIGYGWNVTRVGDANDLEMLARAFRTFLNIKDKPTLIIVDSHIGYGSPNKQDTSGAHGEPLGEEEIRLAKRHYGWPEDKKFYVPEGVYDHFRHGVGTRGKNLRADWFMQIDRYRRQYPDLAEELFRMQHRQLPERWDRDLPEFPADPKGLANSRVLGQDSERGRQEHSQVDWRVRRPRPLHQDPHHARGRRRFLGGELCGPKSALRDPRARHGRDTQRTQFGKSSALRVGLLHLCRLYAGIPPFERPDGTAGGLRVYPRLHRSRRRWPHSSTHRTARPHALHGWANHDPTR
jgi:hypothetical protein